MRLREVTEEPWYPPEILAALARHRFRRVPGVPRWFRPNSSPSRNFELTRDGVWELTTTVYQEHVHHVELPYNVPGATVAEAIDDVMVGSRLRDAGALRSVGVQVIDGVIYDSYEDGAPAVYWCGDPALKFDLLADFTRCLETATAVARMMADEDYESKVSDQAIIASLDDTSPWPNALNVYVEVGDPASHVISDLVFRSGLEVTMHDMQYGRELESGDVSEMVRSARNLLRTRMRDAPV